MWTVFDCSWVTAAAVVCSRQEDRHQPVFKELHKLGPRKQYKKEGGGRRDGMEADRQSARRAVILKDLGHVTEKRAAAAPRR